MKAQLNLTTCANMPIIAVTHNAALAHGEFPLWFVYIDITFWLCFLVAISWQIFRDWKPKMPIRFQCGNCMEQFNQAEWLVTHNKEVHGIELTVADLYRMGARKNVPVPTNIKFDFDKEPK